MAKKRRKVKDKEYSKRMLTKIINNAMLMMWGTYVLAWFDHAEIAETLSKTIASSVIAVAIGYFAKSALENISKHTTAFGENVFPISEPEDEAEDEENQNRDC